MRTAFPLNPSTRKQQNRRRRVLERDGHTCLRCGTTAALTLDHVIPVSMGGTNAPGNLQTLCEPCNQWKANRAMDFRKRPSFKETLRPSVRPSQPRPFIAPCPECGSDLVGFRHTRLVQHSAPGGLRECSRVECGTCKRTGWWATSPVKAAKVWPKSYRVSTRLAA
jgi:5-methylcytosine-specific restriction protein A